MDNLIDKIKSYFTTASSASEETIKELQERTKLLEQQAEYAETAAQLLARADKAKKRMKAVRKSKIRPIYIIVGLVFLGITILIIARGC